MTLARRALWWLQDYVYVAFWQVAGLLHRGGGEPFLAPEHPREPTVVIVPGIY